MRLLYSSQPERGFVVAEFDLVNLPNFKASLYFCFGLSNPKESSDKSLINFCTRIKWMFVRIVSQRNLVEKFFYVREFMYKSYLLRNYGG